MKYTLHFTIAPTHAVAVCTQEDGSALRLDAWKISENCADVFYTDRSLAQRTATCMTNWWNDVTVTVIPVSVN